MEFINSPTRNTSNGSENLIFQSSLDEQQNVDINQFFVEKNVNHQIIELFSLILQFVLQLVYLYVFFYLALFLS